MNFKIITKSLKDKSKDEIIKEYIDLYKEKEKLEKELKKYKNSNTPSSANKHLKANTEGLKKKKRAKRGAPKGHKGNTFIWPSIDKIIDVIAKRCLECSGLNIQATGHIKERKVVCLIKPKKLIKMYRLFEYRCLDCNRIFFAHHKDFPKKGIYDKSIQSLVNYFKFKGRMPFGNIVDMMNNVFDIPMTEPTALEITRRTSEEFEPQYNEIEEQIKKSSQVNADETSQSVMGENQWVWAFCNSLLSLFKINKQRGGDIVEKILGKNFKGKLIVDGWPTYAVFSKKYGILLQRCWAHLIREGKYECEKDFPHFYKWLNDIYIMAKKGKDYKQKKRREDMHYKCKEGLKRLIASMNAHTKLRTFANKIENGGGDWFTALLHPEMPLDNNLGERSIRSWVIMRKIMGCIRSDLGKKNYEIMMSLVSTWEKQGKNVFYTLQQSL